MSELLTELTAQCAIENDQAMKNIIATLEDWAND